MVNVMKYKIKILFPILTSIIVGLLIAVLVNAWTNPSQAPSGGGGALYYSGGNVGIGTTNPTAGLLTIAAADESIKSAIAIRQSNAQTYGFDFNLDQSFNGYMFLDRVYNGTKYNVMTFNRDNSYIGVGTSTPGAGLVVFGADGDANGALRVGSPSAFRSIYGVAGGDLNFNNGVNVGVLNSAGNWIGASDISYKTDIMDMLKYGLNTVMQMRPREYKMKNTNIPQVGFIAQEMREIVPEVVSGEEGNLGISYGQIAPILAKAIQELHTSLEQLKKENLELKTIVCKDHSEEQICLK